MKKIQLSTTIAFFISLCYCSSMFSQISVSNSTIEQTFKDAQLIFEGKSIGFRVYKDKDGRKYTAFAIQISKIFKNNLNIHIGTIEIVRKGSDCGVLSTGEIIIVPVADDLPFYSPAIYFCTISDLPITGTYGCIKNEQIGYTTDINEIISVDNSIRLKEIGSIGFSSPPIGLSFSGYGFGKRFNTKQEIYDFLSQHENITIPPPEPEKKKEEEKPQPTQAQSDSIQRADSTLKEENRKLYEQRKKNSDQYMQQLMERIKIAEENQKKKNAEGKKEDE